MMNGKNCLVNAIKINPHKKEYWFELAEISNIANRNQYKLYCILINQLKLKPTSEDYRGKSDGISLKSKKIR